MIARNYGINDPQWQVWKTQGRIPTGEHTIEDYQGAYEQLLQEDKRIGQYYKLSTGQDASPEVISQYGQYANDPSLLEAAINKGQNLAPALGKYKDQINTAIQEKMGRQATEAELGYFGKQMEQGNLDAYGLQDFLQGTTEYQNKSSDTARTKLAGELGNVDTEYLGKVQKALEQKYAAQGRQGASAFGSELVNAGKDIATQRTGYLAGLGYQDFQSGQENLKNAYQNRLAQVYANQQGISTAQGASTARYYSQQDQQRQQAAQDRLYKLSQPKQGTFLEGLVPGLIQTGATIGGALIGGPPGAAAGSAIGGGLSNSLSLGYGYPTRYPGGLMK